MAKTMGGSDTDVAVNAIQTNDGGYICTGVSSSYNGDFDTINLPGDHDAWIVKLDAIGNVEW